MAETPTPTPSPTPTPTPSPTPSASKTEVDYEKIVEGLVKKHGDANGAILELVRQTHTLREKNRGLSEKAPKEGDVVLSGDAVSHWAKYRELGSPSDLRKALDDGKQAQGALGGLLKENSVREAAKLHKFEPDVLLPLVKDMEIEIKDLTDKDGKPIGLDGRRLPADGKPVQRAFVKVKDKDGEKSVNLDDFFAKDEWSKFLPALRPEKSRHLGPPPPNDRPGSTPPANPKSLYGGSTAF